VYEVANLVPGYLPREVSRAIPTVDETRLVYRAVFQLRTHGERNRLLPPFRKSLGKEPAALEPVE